MKKIIAVDFDGTLSLGVKYPEIGVPNYKLFEDLSRARSSGAADIILWTCRSGDDLTKAVNWCSENGLEFDAINDNLECIKKKFGGDTRKVVANLYIDDKSVKPEDFGGVEYESFRDI